MSEIIKYGNGSYRIASILRQSREDFVNTNKIYLVFSQASDDVKRKAQLGELWDAANAAAPKEPAKEVAPAANPKGRKGADKHEAEQL